MPSSPLLLRCLVAVVALAGCGGPITEPSAPAGRPNFSSGPGDDDEVTIIDLAADHPQFFNQSVSFWAKVGASSEGAIYFLDDRGRRGDRYARFKVNSNSLLRYPDGRLFSAGDSILITMRVVTGTDVMIDMEPSGLRFRPGKLPELRIDYTEANADFNADGVIDALDTAIEQSLSIWMQEGSEPFAQISSTLLPDEEELVAKIPGFSRFAIAY